jgi:hypothetical protein|uniref:Uncharacterized protein n=1 Tax=viral metagenome TaxID=1070528 RepID=A0A6C0BGH3_9ZZZZ
MTEEVIYNCNVGKLDFSSPFIDFVKICDFDFYRTIDNTRTQFVRFLEPFGETMLQIFPEISRYLMIYEAFQFDKLKTLAKSYIINMNDIGVVKGWQAQILKRLNDDSFGSHDWCLSDTFKMLYTFPRNLNIKQLTSYSKHGLENGKEQFEKILAERNHECEEILSACEKIGISKILFEKIVAYMKQDQTSTNNMQRPTLCFVESLFRGYSDNIWCLQSNYDRCMIDFIIKNMEHFPTVDESAFKTIVNKKFGMVCAGTLDCALQTIELPENEWKVVLTENVECIFCCR